MSNKLFNAISAAGVDIKKAAEVGVLSIETLKAKWHSFKYPEFKS